MKKDSLFGDHRVSTILDSIWGKSRNAKMEEMVKWCEENTCLDDDDSSMITYAGVKEGEVVWCFDNEKDAILFALKWA